MRVYFLGPSGLGTSCMRFRVAERNTVEVSENLALALATGVGVERLTAAAMRFGPLDVARAMR